MAHFIIRGTRRGFSAINRLSTLGIGVFLIAIVFSAAAFGQSINFETPTYTIGDINGQDSWMKTGAYDAAVAASAVPTFGSQSLRMSNAVTSGSFGDQTFSKSLVNEAGETAAVSGGYSGGARKNRFVMEFDIASVVPGAQQADLRMTASPDRGDGSRMSFLRFEDLSDGIHVFFAEYVDLSPFGSATGDDANGCNAGGDAFIVSDIATIDRSTYHRIRMEIDFVDGPRNDVVRVFVDGTLFATGTSWEDYYRYCAEQAGNGNQIPTTDNVLFRSSGLAAPSNAGNGFFFDNLTLYSPSTLVVDDNLACPNASFTTIGSAVGASSPGDIIDVCAGSYPEMVNVNKTLTIRGAQAGIDARNRPTTPAEEAVVSGNSGSTAFYVSASDTVIDGFTIQGNTNVNLFGAGVYIGANVAGTELLNNIIQNNIIGSYLSNNSPVNPMVISRNLFRNNTNPGAASGNGIYSDEYTASGTLQNVLIDNNTFDGNTNAGITLASTDGTKLQTNITISNNEFKNGGLGFGIYATNVTSSSISSNLFTNINQGIRVNEGSANLAVTCNAIRGGVRGIRFAITGTSNPIASSVTVNNNDIFGQTLHGIEVNPITYFGTLNAENNWWGLASGPTIGNLPPSASQGSIAGAVDANPFLTAPASCAPNYIKVDLINMNGWSSISQRTANGEFVQGPSTAPLGTGSYRMTTGAGNAGPDLPPPGGAGQGGKTWLTTQAYDGTRLADIAHLSYSTYVSPSSPTTNLTPSLQFQVDLDGNGTRDSSMIFEPVYSVATQGPITPGAWQDWNARAGKWWFNQATVFGCGACAYVTYDQVIAAYPNAKIMTWFARTDGYGTQFQAGQNSAGAPWANFDGNIDNFRIGINSPGDTYDFEPLPCVVVTTLPHIDTLTNVTVNIPISTPTDLTGRNITATSFILNYNPSVLSSNPVDIVLTPGPAAPGSVIVANTNNPGAIEVSVHSASAFTGSGTIVNLQMKVIGPIGSNTPLDISNLAVYQINPISVVCSTEADGDLTVISGTISGNVTYKMDIDSPAGTVTQPVKDAVITATGPLPLPTPSVTDVLGNYSMNGFGAGLYTIDASKIPKICGSPTNGINSNDATSIAQHVVHLRTLTSDQQEAAAVSGLIGPTSLDASLVARFVVCFATPGNLAGNWKFKPQFLPGPVNTATGGTYDYLALLMGDVTGDWSPGGALRPPINGKNSVKATIPSIEAAQGSTVIVPFRFDNLRRGEKVDSYQFDISFNPSVVSPADVAVSLEGTLGQGLNVVWNTPIPGLLKVAVYGIHPVSGDGVYANLKFNVIGNDGASSPFGIGGVRYNDNARGVIATDGGLRIHKSKSPTKRR